MSDSSPDAVVHFPGGRLGPADWTVLAGVAAGDGGGGDLLLSPGGGVLARRRDGTGVTPADLVAAGLSPHVVDDRLPHIIASPMAGLLDGHHDLADLCERVCSELLGRTGLRGLRGRLQVGLDDGSGDVLAHSPDVALVAGRADGALAVYVAGDDTSVEVPFADAPTVLADLPAELHRAGLAGPGRRDPVEVRRLVLPALRAHPRVRLNDRRTPAAIAVETPRVGWVDTIDGSVSLLAVVPDGVVPSRLAEFLGAVERPSTVSADRVIGLHGLTEAMAEQVVRVLAPMGMVFDDSSPWAGGTV